MNALSQIPRNIKIFGFILVILIIVLTVFVALQTPSEPTPPPETKIIPLQKTKVGQSFTPQTESSLKIINKEATVGGTIYSLDSQNPIRTDQIITQNNQVVFERVYIPENPNDPNHLLISTLVQKYGQPESIIQGSKTWGPYINLYLYAGKGIAFIGNPNTDEVYELQTFKPLSTEEYIQKYGDDINTNPPQGES